MEIVKGFRQPFLSGVNGKRGFVGVVFIFMLFTFVVPMYLFLLNVGSNIIVKESMQAAGDAAVLAGLQEVQKVSDSTGGFGQSESWHYEVMKPQALASAQQTFEKNLQNLQLETHFKVTLLQASPTFSFPDEQSMTMNMPFKVGMEDFNKANEVFNPSIPPSADWLGNGRSKSTFTQPGF